MDDLECDLVVFHPYRALMNLATEYRSETDTDREVGELGG